MSYPNDSITVLIDNCELVLNMHWKMAGEAISAAPDCDQVHDEIWNVEQAERIILEQKLKDWYTDMVDDIRILGAGYKPRSESGQSFEKDNHRTEHQFRQALVEALVIHAFGRIDFFELACQLLKDYRERHEQNN
jgi:hypothetical protein